MNSMINTESVDIQKLETLQSMKSLENVNISTVPNV